MGLQCLSVGFAVFAAMAVIWPTPSVAANASLHIYNWPNYLYPAVTDVYTARTGTPVKQFFYQSDEQRDRSLFGRFGNRFDIIIIDNARLAAYAAAGLVEDLSTYPIGNKKNIDPRWQKTCGRYGVPFAWGIQGIAYRYNQLSTPVTSWNQLLDPADELKGHIFINDDAIELFAMALQALEREPNTDNREALINAYHLLRRQKPYVYGYGQSSQLKAEAIKEIKAMSIYGGEFLQMFGSAPHAEWRFTYPDEGSTIWVDCMAITTRSEHKSQAADFINFFLQPKYQALNTTYSLHTPVVMGVERYLDSQLLRNPILFPDPIVIYKSPIETIFNRDSIRLRQRMAASLILGKRLEN